MPSKYATIIFATLFSSSFALDNGLARTPPMGWNTWNHFGCNINEDIILSAANALVSTSLRDRGYEYVIVDDCWHAPNRDLNTSAPMADPNRFSKGIKHLSDAVHALGLKFGIYSSAGTMTCGRQFGSLDHERIDAQTYAEWGVDYLKYDNCHNEGRAGYNLISYERYANMSKALQSTGKDIVYAMCNWGEDGPWNWAPTIAHTWRISGDIMDEFDRHDDRCPCTSMIDCKLPGFHCAVTRIIDFLAPLGQKAGPGQWNDLDMLEVGNGGMTKSEYITHFSMWAIAKSPLILGNNLEIIDDETMEIISNNAIISVNQDRLGQPAARIWKKPQTDGGDLQLWAGPLADGSTVVALLNTSPKGSTIDLLLSDVFVGNRFAAKRNYHFYDLWVKDPSTGSWGNRFGTTATGVMHAITVDSHLTRVFKVIRVDETEERLQTSEGSWKADEL